MKRWLRRLRSIDVGWTIQHDGQSGWIWIDENGEDDRLYATKWGAWLSAMIS